MVQVRSPMDLYSYIVRDLVTLTSSPTAAILHDSSFGDYINTIHNQ